MNGNSNYRSYVDSTSKRHRKIHVENPSIFRRFWKSNPWRNFHSQSMSQFLHGFDFQNWSDFRELFTWNFNVESMASQLGCVHWEMIIEAVVQRCSVKKLFLKILKNSQESTCARVSLLIKLQTSGNFIKKEALAQVFS